MESPKTVKELIECLEEYNENDFVYIIGSPTADPDIETFFIESYKEIDENDEPTIPIVVLTSTFYIREN